MKICHINLAKGFRGGERQTLILIEYLATRFQQAVIVRKSNKSFIEKLKRIKRIKIITISKPFMISSYKLREFDLVHAHEAKAAHIALLGKKFFKTPYIITRRVTYNLKKNFITRKTYNEADKVIALSNAIKHILSQSLSGLNIETIPDSSSQLTSNPTKVKKIKSKGDFIVGNIGALVDDDKGQSFIIKAAHEIYKTHPDILFLLIGDGKDRGQLEALSEKHPNIIFTGFVNNVGDYIEALDIFLFPSLNEGLGSSLIDAMSFGKPIVATKVGGIVDLIRHEKNGLLINARSVSEIKKSIILLYENSHLRTRLATQAQLDSSHYDIEAVAERYISVYFSIYPPHQS